MQIFWQIAHFCFERNIFNYGLPDAWRLCVKIRNLQHESARYSGYDMKHTAPDVSRATHEEWREISRERGEHISSLFLINRIDIRKISDKTLVRSDKHT